MSASTTARVLEEDDTVGRVARGALRLGVVTGVFDEPADDSDSDDDGSSAEARLRSGQVRVEWHPSGRGSRSRESNLVLVDRSLLLGDTVRRAGDAATGRVGYVVAVHVNADLAVLPHGQFVLRHVDLSALDVVGKYSWLQSAEHRCFILFDGWIGHTSDSVERLKLRSLHGDYRCWLNADSQADIADVVRKRVYQSQFDLAQWYPKQLVLVSYEALMEAEWLDGSKPPARVLYAIKNRKFRSGAMHFVIEQVDQEALSVVWHTSLRDDFAVQPSNVISGQDLLRVTKLENFSYHWAQIGDRFSGSVSDKLNVTRLEDWTAEVERLVVDSEAAVQPAPTDHSRSAQSDEMVAAKRKKMNSPMTTAGADHSSAPSAATDAQVATTAAAGSRRRHHTAHRVLATRGGRAARQMPSGSARRPKAKAQKTDPVLAALESTAERPSVGAPFIGEVLLTRCRVDVLWQDGCLEEGVTATELICTEYDIDDHVFVPGSFVLLRTDAGEWPPNGYGVVVAVDATRRIASVRWYELPAGADTSAAPLLVRADEVSLLELVEHADFRFLSPGCLVTQIWSAESAPASFEALVGQVLRVDVQSGSVEALFFDGRQRCLSPMQIFRVLADEELDEAFDDGGPTDSHSDGGGGVGAARHLLDALSGAVSNALGSVFHGLQLPTADDDADWETASDSGDETTTTEPMTSTSSANVSLPEPLGADTLEMGDAGGGSFEVVGAAPAYHSFFASAAVSKPSRHFMKALKENMRVLRSSLPDDIHVKSFEDRLDLFSCLIRGPDETPYTSGLFLIDIKLPAGYPNEPPHAFYKSYSSESVNPNLYQDGKVCLSLLGTWSGRASERWNPGSNLLQVFVSVQGLILNAEPYFNEAGYESRRKLAESAEKSRRFNEMTLVRSVENLANLASNPPSIFRAEIRAHVRVVGEQLLTRLSGWLDGSLGCTFPLQPISEGCKASATLQLAKLRKVVDEAALPD